MPTKTLEFFFRKTIDDENESPRHRMYREQNDGSDVYHTVNGRRRRGLIIDPGAANGLIGSETLRDLLQHIDQAKEINDTIVWRPRQSEVTGISGSADTTLGEITIPLPMLSGIKEYRADVIGGEASMCPALVGNPALVNMSAVIASNWFANRDGLLAIPHQGDLQLLRLLYTDSRHYLLPLDEVTNETELDYEKDKAKTFLSNVHEKSSARWKDVRSWFTWATTAKPKRSECVEAKEVSSHNLSCEIEQATSTATTDSPVKNEKDSGGTGCSLIQKSNETSAATDSPVENEKDSGGHMDQCVSQHDPAYATQVITYEMLTASQGDPPKHYFCSSGCNLGLQVVVSAGFGIADFSQLWLQIVCAQGCKLCCALGCRCFAPSVANFLQLFLVL